MVGAGLVAVSIFTSLISFRLGAPLLLIFLLLDLAVGEDGLGLEFDNAAAAYVIGSVALAIILFDSGFSTTLRTFRVEGARAWLKSCSKTGVKFVTLKRTGAIGYDRRRGGSGLCCCTADRDSSMDTPGPPSVAARSQ